MQKVESVDTATNIETQIGVRLAGKYLTFMLGTEEYGVHIRKVQEIIRMQSITAVPKTPEYIRGVINLRGMIVPVIDLRTKFSMPQEKDTDKTCIVVVQVQNRTVMTTTGIVIDDVKEVLNITADCIEAVPSFGTDVAATFLKGVARVDGKIKMLLDIEIIVSVEEIDTLSSMSEQP